MLPVLQTAGGLSYAGLGEFGALAGVAIGVLVVVLIVAYLFFAWTLWTLAKKMKAEPAWLAWIPLAQLFLIPIMAGYHWAFGFLFLIPFVNIVASVFFFWKVYEKRKYPGWWAVVCVGGLIPLIGFVFSLASLVLYMIVVFKDK